LEDGNYNCENNMTYFSLVMVIDSKNELWEKKEIDAKFQN
jgi:hypothetical protein